LELFEFLRNVIELEEGQGMVTEMIRQLRKALMKALTDFGRHLGYDGKSIKGGTGHGNMGTGKGYSANPSFLTCVE